jgi:type VI secretion system secreted protein VgrG
MTAGAGVRPVMADVTALRAARRDNGQTSHRTAGVSGEAEQPLLLLTSPLGDDTLPFQQGTLHAVALSAREWLSRPFEAAITAVSTRRSIDPDELVGRPVCLTVRWRPGGDRLIHGIVRRLTAVSLPQRDRWQYVLDVVPRLRLMEQAADCRIFQDRTASEILRTLFAEHDVSPVEFRISGAQPRREYTTQYNETDLDFAQRLMQESGWFYFFEHSRTGHTLVVCDHNRSFRPLAPFRYRVVHAGDNVDVFSHWHESLQTAHGRVRLEDYDPTRPRTPVSGQQETTLGTAGAARRRVFRWPAMTQEDGVAGQRARFHIEASEAQAQLGSGRGFDPQFAPGRRFAMAHDPFTWAEGREYVLHGVEHQAVDDTWVVGGGTARYSNSFTCLRETVPWRDAPTLPRPAMAGIFSAVTLGNAGEEIHADPLGRIKVRLLFDHRRDTVAARAIWARVAQPWSGSSWGWQHLPRVGTEVAVSFMSGDPDSPVVVGCFYNQDQQPVFPIPSQQTRQGFRSRSTLHGGTQEYSELSFDDRRGEELVLLHAQLDHRIEVERDQDASIGRDRSVETMRDDSLVSRTGNVSIDAVAGCVTISAAKTITLRVGGTSVILTETGINLSALADISISALGIVTTEAVGDVNTSAAGAVTIEATGDVNIAGAAVTIEAADGEVDCIPFPV